jgi:hypothetical protein
MLQKWIFLILESFFGTDRDWHSPFSFRWSRIFLITNANPHLKDNPVATIALSGETFGLSWYRTLPWGVSESRFPTPLVGALT